ncbi:hypothetical protein BH20VER1_BH20VER1_17020 [soil metagenome]
MADAGSFAAAGNASDPGALPLFALQLECKKNGIKVRERPASFLDLRPRGVHFQSDQVCHFQRFGEHRSDAGQMRQQTLRIGVAFAAEKFI